MKDFFGNEIEVGDVVLRNCNSTTYVTKVLRVTSKGIGLQRTSWQKEVRVYDYTTHQWETRNLRAKPLYTQHFDGVNLTKLNQSQINKIIEDYEIQPTTV